MEGHPLFTALEPELTRRVGDYLKSQPVRDVASVQKMGRLATGLCRFVVATVFAVWADLLEKAAVAWARPCPICGEPRTIQRRSKERLRVELLVATISIGKPYLRCEKCRGHGISVVHLLTGLRSGECSLGLKLEAARLGADNSYGKTRRALENQPLDRVIERTKLRRMALEVESWALEFAEERRQATYAELGAEGRRDGVPLLILEADGAKVRTGELTGLTPGDPGYGKKTPLRGLPRRKRPAVGREVITMDVRKPGQVDATALDVLVPVTAKEGERSRRMLALAGRSGLGDNTEMYGLGDMGSGLAAAFDEAFHDRESFWAADMRHTWDYVKEAAGVLGNGLDTRAWIDWMWVAIHARSEELRDSLLIVAKEHRVEELAARHDRCPVHALSTYLSNNFDRMRFREMKARDLPVVSARAEAQVRDFSKARLSVPGAWKLENLEGKVTVRVLIGEGSWLSFAAWCYERQEAVFEERLQAALAAAVAEKRISPAAAALLLDPATTLATLLGDDAGATHDEAEGGRVRRAA